MASVQQYLNEANGLMDKAIQHLEQELTKVRAGKINPSILDGLLVDYYGTPSPIGNVANVSVADARTLLIQPWEKKMLEPIEKAIIGGNIGINPMNDGTMIKLFMPPLTEERRKEYVKKAHTMGEAARVSIRTIRRDAIEHIKKLGKEHVPEDEVKGGENAAQGLTDKYIGLIDKHLQAKEKEIMTV